jgi:DNA-binding HxlR family transcriptional regulator
VEDGTEVERDRQRAEVFDALGHPTRIVILKALSEGALGFADLKKKTAIDSSGHLQHHLTKLNGLIKTDEYGKYCLSDQGKDALLTVRTVENSSPRNNNYEETHRHYFNAKIGLKFVSFLLIALLVTSSAIAVYEYNQTVGVRKENTFLNGVNPEAAAYYNEFGAVTLATNVNSSFAPPISMYQALLVGFAAGGWNKTSLQGTVVSINLVFWKTVTNMTALLNDDAPVYTLNPYVPSSPLNPTYVTSPPADYSDVYSNGVTYQYVWQIDIQGSSLMELTNGVVPYQVLVDASTGHIVPNIIYEIANNYSKNEP